MGILEEIKSMGRQGILEEIVFIKYQNKIDDLISDQSQQTNIKTDIDYLVYQLGKMRPEKNRLRTLGQIIILMKINILSKHCI